MRSSVPSRRLTRLGAIPLLFLTIVGLLVGGLSAPAFAANTIKGTVSAAGPKVKLSMVIVVFGSCAADAWTAIAAPVIKPAAIAIRILGRDVSRFASTRRPLGGVAMLQSLETLGRESRIDDGERLVALAQRHGG